MNLLDLLDYVDKNPKDYKKRWELAKKLYQNKDYVLALEHLTILVNEWEPHINVYRFLSATLYRLGKYDEAIKNLKIAIEKWENEPGLYEQLGKALITAGKIEEAKKVYKKLSEIYPEHRWAETAVAKIESFLSKKHVRKTPFPFTFTTDFDLLPDTICKRCGIENKGYSDRCQKCGEPLTLESAQPEFREAEISLNQIVTLTPEIITLLLGLATISFLSIHFFMCLKFYLGDYKTAHVSLTFWDIYRYELFHARFVTSILLLIISPLTIRLGSKITGLTEKIPNNLVILTGLLIASFINLASWLPKPLFLWGFILVPIFSFLVILGLFTIPIIKSLTLCLFQILLLFVSTTIIFSAVESHILNTFINPFTQIPAASRYFLNQYLQPPHTIEIKGLDGSSQSVDLYFEKTGSYWLDMRANKILIELFLDNEDTFILEVNKGETKPIIYQKEKSTKWSTHCIINTDEIFTIKIATENNTPYVAQVHSLFILSPR